MRDLHLAGNGKKIHILCESHVQMTEIVRKTWPKAKAEGSCGAWSWTELSWTESEEFIVAEAWLHGRCGWWLRVREKES